MSDNARRPRTVLGQMEYYKGQSFQKLAYAALGEAIYLVLFPLIVIFAVLYLVFFWAYLVFWCGWRGGPE